MVYDQQESGRITLLELPRNLRAKAGAEPLATWILANTDVAGTAEHGENLTMSG